MSIDIETCERELREAIADARRTIAFACPGAMGRVKRAAALGKQTLRYLDRRGPAPKQTQ